MTDGRLSSEKKIALLESKVDSLSIQMEEALGVCNRGKQPINPPLKNKVLTLLKVQSLYHEQGSGLASINKRNDELQTLLLVIKGELGEEKSLVGTEQAKVARLEEAISTLQSESAKSERRQREEIARDR